MVRMTARPHLRRTLIALVATAALTLAGCGGEEPEAEEPTPTTSPPASQSTESPSAESPSESPGPSEPAAAASVDVTIQGDDVQPVAQAVSVGVGETVLLNITSDRAGELHVHATPEQEPSFGAGESTVEITLDKPGTVDVEEHESGVLLVRILVK